MKRQRIPVIVLMLILLLNMAGFAAAEVTPEASTLPAVETTVPAEQAADTAEAETMPAATQPPAEDTADANAPAETAPEAAPAEDTAPVADAAPAQQEAAQKQKLYIVLVDSGFALYGSKVPKASVIGNPGDAEGHVLTFMRDSFSGLMNENALVLAYGYHSDLVETVPEPVAANDAKAVEGMFNKLYKLSAGSRVSSRPDMVLEKLWEKTADLTNDYDCELIMVTGGIMNGGSSAADPAVMAAGLEPFRAAGVKISAVGLNLQAAGLLQEGVDPALCCLDACFAEGEYAAAGFELIEGAADYTSAHINMMESILSMILPAGEWTIERSGIASHTELVQKAVDCGADDKLVLWCSNAEEAVTGVYTVETLDANPNIPVIEEQDRCVLWLCKKQAAQQAAAEQVVPEVDPAEAAVIEAAAVLGEQIQTRTETGIDVASGEQVFDLPQGFDPAKATLSSSNTAVLDLRVEGSQLTIKPVSAGSADVICTLNGKAHPIPVVVRDTRIDWSWETGAEYSLSAEGMTGTELKTDCYSGVLNWYIKVLSGPNAGKTASGSSAEPASCELDGVSWELTENGGMKSLSIQAEAMGEYSLSCWITEAPGGAVLAEESQDFSVHSPVDPINNGEAIVLVTPFFREQEGQRIAITSNGAPVDLANYVCELNPTGVADYYMSPDRTSLYIVPGMPGEVTLSVKEAYFEDSQPAEVAISIQALTSNVMLWVCGAGAVLCLIGLTAAIVILIGKKSSRAAKERSRR